MSAAEHTRPGSGKAEISTETPFLLRAALCCHRNRVFLALFGSVVAVRLAILLVAQNHVHADEAIIGLMAKHVLEKGARPIYFYGQVFNGGAALEAYLTAPIFHLLGPGVQPLKLTIVLLSAGSWALLYLLVRRFWNDRMAWMAGALFALSPTLLPWHFQVRGGYGEYHFFMLSIFYATFALAESDRPSTRWYLLFGFTSGIALWCFELVLPVVILSLAYLAAVNRRAWANRRAAWSAAAALAGYFPALHFNLTHGAANWRFILQEKIGGGRGFAALLEPDTWHRIFFYELPRFFGPETVLWYKEAIRPSGWVFYGLALAALAHALWQYRRSHLRLLAGLFQKEQRLDGGGRTSLLVILILACLIPYAMVETRVPGYLLGTVPLLSILQADWIKTLLASRRRLMQGAAAAALAAGIAFGAYEHLRFLGSDHIESLKLTAQGRLAPTTISGPGLARTLAHLEARGISAVLASPSLQYPIIFESGERILASSAPLPFRYIVYPDYDRTVARAIGARPVFVIEADYPLRPLAFSIIRQMAPGRISLTEFDGIHVIEGEGH
jgi:4-amino-4-deoxy-L-arabinose transferase-like glycosyltransferase